MNWNWYKIINLSTVTAANVPDYIVEVDLEGLGRQTILIAQGFNINVLFMGYWLTPYLNNRNGFSLNHTASAYIDEENNLWVGYNADNLS